MLHFVLRIINNLDEVWGSSSPGKARTRRMPRSDVGWSRLALMLETADARDKQRAGSDQVQLLSLFFETIVSLTTDYDTYSCAHLIQLQTTI